MSISPTLFHSSVDQSLPGSTDKQHIVGNSSNPTCTQCIYLQRIQGGRSNSLYLSHIENSGLQWGCSHRAKKGEKQEKKCYCASEKQTNECQQKNNSTLSSICESSTAVNFHCLKVAYLNYKARHFSLFYESQAITLNTFTTVFFLGTYITYQR